MVVGLAVEGDGGDPTLRRGDEQGADRRVDDVEAQVDETQRSGCVAEAAVELGRDGHEAILLRRRRTPVDVAWRAATADEPSAPAIWS